MPEALTPFKTRIPKPVKSSTDTSKSTSSASRSTTTANPTSTSTPNSTSTSNFQYDRYNYNQCNQYNRYRQTPPRPPLNSKNRNIYCQLGDLEPPPSPFTQITTAINNRLKTPPPRPTNKSTEQLSYTFFSLVRTPRGQAPLTLAPAKPKPSVSNCASNTSNTSNTLPSPSEQRRVVSVRGVEYDIAPVFYLGGRKGSFESNSSRSTTRQLPPKPPIVTKVASQPIYPWELRPTTATHFNSQTPPPIYQSMPAIYDTLQSNRPMSVAPSSFAAPTPTPQRNFQTPLPIMPLSEPVQTPPPPPPPPTPTPFHAQCRAAQCETPPPPQQIAVPVPVPVPVGVPVPVSVPVGVPVPVPVPVHCCSDQSNNNECRPRLGKVKIRKQKRRKNRMVDAFMGPPLVIPGYMAFIENLERCQQANNNCLAQTCF